MKGCLKPFLSQSLPLVTLMVFIPVQRYWLSLKTFAFKVKSCIGWGFTHEIKTEINLDENRQPCAVDRKYCTICLTKLMCSAFGSKDFSFESFYVKYCILLSSETLKNNDPQTSFKRTRFASSTPTQ